MSVEATDKTLVACPRCATANRVPAERLGDVPKCGKCGAALLDGKPLALDQAAFVALHSMGLDERPRPWWSAASAERGQVDGPASPWSNRSNLNKVRPIRPMDMRHPDTAPSRAGEPFETLGRKKAYEEVTEHIRRRIFSQRLRPADRLPTERDLADQFGVSRVVIREAVRALELAGLLSVKKGPKGGIFVAQSYDRPIAESIVNLLAGGNASLEHLFELRLLIEPYAVSRAAVLATRVDLERLDRLLAECEESLDRGEEIRPKNLAFHREVMRMSRNPVLVAVGETVLRILSERIAHIVSPEMSRSVLRMHHRIAAAIRRRQPKKAETLMAKDVEAVRRRLARVSANEKA